MSCCQGAIFYLHGVWGGGRTCAPKGGEIVQGGRTNKSIETSKTPVGTKEP